MRHFKLRHGIAAVIEAIRDDGVSWDVVYGYEHESTSWPRGHDPLPQKVKDACAPWFAEVFAVPVGERQAIIDRHNSAPIELETD